jgi:hypothetical protein
MKRIVLAQDAERRDRPFDIELGRMLGGARSAYAHVERFSPFERVVPP